MRITMKQCMAREGRGLIDMGVYGWMFGKRSTQCTTTISFITQVHSCQSSLDMAREPCESPNLMRTRTEMYLIKYSEKREWTLDKRNQSNSSLVDMNIHLLLYLLLPHINNDTTYSAQMNSIYYRKSVA